METNEMCTMIKVHAQQECGLSRSTEVLGKQDGQSARIVRDYVENDGPTVGLMAE